MSGTVPPGARPARRLPLRALMISVAALAVLGLIAALAADAAAGGILQLRDAGAIARRGAPVTAMIAQLAGAVMLGGAVLAGWLLPGGADRARAMGLVAVAAGVTTLARGASLVFSYAVATGQAVGAERFGSDMGIFIGTDLGIWLLIGLVLAAVATTAAVTGSSVGLARTVAVLAGAIAFAGAMTGHAAGDDTHEVATSTMLVHLLAVGIWVGGLATLQLLPAAVRDDVRVVRGYSHLALICWIALALSGVWALAVRMNTPAELLTSAYVQLGLAKAALLAGLAVLGVLQRRQIAAGLGADGEGGRAVRSYRRLAILELALMGLAVALAAAMSSSPPPAEVGTPADGPAAVLSGYALPPAPGPVTLLTAWRPDPFGMALACAMLLRWWRPRGPERPRGATIRLVLAAVILVVLTSGPLNVYGKVLISAHLLQHLLLFAAAGVLIGSVAVLPRALRSRLAGRSWASALLALAPVAALIGVYAAPPLLHEALDGHAAHLALQMLALAGGALTAGAVRSAERPVTVMIAPLVALLAAGVTLMISDVLIAASWFGATGRTWWADALADQRRGGAAVVIVTVVLAVVALSAQTKIPRTVRRRASS